MATKLNETKAKWPQGYGFFFGRTTNEENYALMRLARGSLYVSTTAPALTYSTVAGLAATLGSGAMTNSMRETNKRIILVTGTNTNGITQCLAE